MTTIDDDNFTLQLNEFRFEMRDGHLNIYNADDDSVYRTVADDDSVTHLIVRALMAKTQGAGYTCPVRATYTSFYFCDDCEHLHIALRDSNNRIYTESVMSDAMMLKATSLIIEERKEFNHDSPSTQPKLP